jgi:hypothetical protein
MFAVLTLLVVGSLRRWTRRFEVGPSRRSLIQASSTEIQSYEREYFYDGGQITRHTNCFRDQIGKYFEQNFNFICNR